MEVDVDVKVILDEPRMRKALERARDGGLRAAGYIVSTIMKKLIKRSREASRPGQPPTTRRGSLRRAIRYAMADNKMSVVIGPASSMFGDAGQAHEYGGRYKSQTYQKRPFAGPALEAALPEIGPQFRGTFYD